MSHRTKSNGWYAEAIANESRIQNESMPLADDDGFADETYANGYLVE